MERVSLSYVCFSKRHTEKMRKEWNKDNKQEIFYKIPWCSNGVQLSKPCYKELWRAIRECEKKPDFKPFYDGVYKRL